jgi:hypothetical protein
MAKCLTCGFSVSWAEERQQFGRLVRTYGFSPQEAKALLPRCSKCLTRKLHGQLTVKQKAWKTWRESFRTPSG